jgi:hypothetical protein
MTKVLALITVAVLAFSAMTGPAFAPPLKGRTGVRVEQNYQPKNTTQVQEWKGLWKGFDDTGHAAKSGTNTSGAGGLVAE